MKFSNIEGRHNLPGRNGNSELVRNVNELVDCFVRIEGRSRIPVDKPHNSVAGNALVAATLAERRICELSDRVRELEKLAMTDELTGLMNRRGFQTALNRSLSSAKRNDEQGVLIYIDLDDFKPVNDQHGHAAGDGVLRHVSRVLTENVRDTDYVGRLGGDEFAVLMPRTDWENGLTKAGTIESRLNTASITWQDQAIHIKASLGLQKYSAGDTPSELLNRADEAMYKTKCIRSGIASDKIIQNRANYNPKGRSLQQLLYAAS